METQAVQNARGAEAQQSRSNSSPDLELCRFDSADALGSLAEFLKSPETLRLEALPAVTESARSCLSELRARPDAWKSVNEAVRRYYTRDLGLSDDDAPVAAVGSFSKGMAVKMTPKDAGVVAHLLGVTIAETLRCGGEAVAMPQLRERDNKLAATLVDAAGAVPNYPEQSAATKALHGFLGGLGLMRPLVPSTTEREEVAKSLAAFNTAERAPAIWFTSGAKLPDLIAERRYAADHAAQQIDAAKLMKKICEVEHHFSPERTQELSRAKLMTLKVAQWVGGIGIPGGIVAGWALHTWTWPIVGAAATASVLAYAGICALRERRSHRAEREAVSTISNELKDSAGCLRRAREYVPFASEFTVP